MLETIHHKPVLRRGPLINVIFVHSEPFWTIVQDTLKHHKFVSLVQVFAEFVQPQYNL